MHPDSWSGMGWIEEDSLALFATEKTIKVGEVGDQIYRVDSANLSGGPDALPSIFRDATRISSFSTTPTATFLELFNAKVPLDACTLG